MEAAGQQSRRPLARGDGLVLSALTQRSKHHEAGQILRLRAEAVGDPRARAGAAGDLRAGVHEHVRRVVVDGLGGHGADDAQLVGDGAGLLEQLAHLLAVLPELLEAKLRPVAVQLGTLQLRDLLPLRERVRHRLAVHLRELRLVIPRLQVRRPARHREPDDALGLRREVQRVYDAGPLVLRSSLFRSGEEARLKKGGEGSCAQPLGGATEEDAAIKGGGEGVIVHG